LCYKAWHLVSLTSTRNSNNRELLLMEVSVIQGSSSRIHHQGGGGATKDLTEKGNGLPTPPP